jgi:hypothetical protein
MWACGCYGGDNVYRILMREPFEACPLGRPRGWENNIKMTRKEIDCGDGR